VTGKGAALVLHNYGAVHVDMFAHNKSGIAYRKDFDGRRDTVVIHKGKPHQQPRLLPSGTN
jgi:hypothetical protein